ncbi:MAG: hypothetical protein ABH858_01860 [Candidatus Omnitrophota bacterium]
MRRILVSLSILLMLSLGSGFAKGDFVIYKDKSSPDNRFIPSGWMGDYGDMKFNDQSQSEPFSGVTCIEIGYTAKRSAGNGWSGIYWQSAANNWGDKQTGFDLTGFNKLSFMARGKEGGEVIALVKVGGIQKAADGGAVPYPDTVHKEYGPIRLTKQWEKYDINLTAKDLSYINGGFCIIFNADQAEKGQVVYLDDILFSSDPSLAKEDTKTNFPFYVYADVASLDNHFIPSGWMPATAAQDLRLKVDWKENPYSGKACIKVSYKNNSGTRWAGIYWQYPANKWGEIPDAGFDLQGATKLTFWAKGEEGGEIINEFKMGGIVSGEYIDSDSVGIGPVKLTKDWNKYEIDLRGRDLSYVIGGFCWATNIDVNNPEGISFYLDEIRYEK